MPVSANYRAFVLEQLGRVLPQITDRNMFGGVAVYSGGLIFALISSDTLYFKVDDETRPDFEAIGMKPFRPFGDGGESMNYSELAAHILEDHEELQRWAERAMAVSRRARGKRSKAKRTPSHGPQTVR
jgi:DNA transformation protein